MPMKFHLIARSQNLPCKVEDNEEIPWLKPELKVSFFAEIDKRCYSLPRKWKSH